MQKVTGRTRVGGDYKEIICPECKSVVRVRHFSWSSLHCETCSSIVPKLEWFIKDTPAAKLGRKGGSVKSEAKTKAARVNAKKPRGKWATAIRYSFTCVGLSTMREGLILVPGKPPERSGAKFWQWARELLQNEPTNSQYTIDEIIEFETRSRLI